MAKQWNKCSPGHLLCHRKLRGALTHFNCLPVFQLLWSVMSILLIRRHQGSYVIYFEQLIKRPYLAHNYAVSNHLYMCTHSYLPKRPKYFDIELVG